MAVDYTATVDGKSYGFDFEDTRIDIDATLDSLDVEDLYTAIKDAQGSGVGIAYATIANGEGLATLSTGIQTFLTVTLLSTWEINTLKSSGKFEVRGGNLIRGDGADPFRDNSLITYIAFLSQAGVLATGSGSSVTAAEIADAVWDEAAADHETAGTMGELLKKAKLFAQNAFSVSL